MWCDQLFFIFEKVRINEISFKHQTLMFICELVNKIYFILFFLNKILKEHYIKEDFLWKRPEAYQMIDLYLGTESEWL